MSASPTAGTVFALGMILSIVGFVTGAALVVSGARSSVAQDAHAAEDEPRLRRWAVVGLAIAVAVGVTPHLYEELGIGGPALLGLGFAAYSAARSSARMRRRTSVQLASALVVPVLATHAAFDGATIAFVSRAGSSVASALISVPVALHRVPEGMLLAGVLLPRAGGRVTLAAACAVAGVTLGGGLLGGAVLDALRNWEHGPLQAAVAVSLGVLLGVVAHRSTHRHA
jgi:hypothetical protein